MSLGLGQAQHPTLLTDAQQRVEEMQQSAIKAVHDAREDALSRISEFSAAVLPAQPLAASNGSAAQPPTGAGNAAAAGTGLLHAAAAAGRASAVLRCMESEPDVNVLDKRGRSALWLAASRGHSTVVVVLAEHGADLELSCNGMTAAYSAAGLGHTHVLWMLSQLGANMQAPDANGITPVSIASHQGHLETVRLLVNLGVDLEAASENGATPFWSACHTGHLEVARLLMSRGVDIQAAARQRTPREIASSGGHTAIVELIDNHNRGGDRVPVEDSSEPQPVVPLVPQSNDSQRASAEVPVPAVESRARSEDSAAIDALVRTQHQLQQQLAQQQLAMQMMMQRVEQQQQDSTRRAQVAEREKALADAQRRREAEQEAISQERAEVAAKNSAHEEPPITAPQLQQLLEQQQHQMLMIMAQRQAADAQALPEPEPEPELRPPAVRSAWSASEPDTPRSASLNQLLGSMEFVKEELSNLKAGESSHQESMVRQSAPAATQWSPPQADGTTDTDTIATQYSPPAQVSAAATQWSPTMAAPEAGQPEPSPAQQTMAVMDSDSPEKWRQPRPSSAPQIRMPGAAAVANKPQDNGAPTGRPPTPANAWADEAAVGPERSALSTPTAGAKPEKSGADGVDESPRGAEDCEDVDVESAADAEPKQTQSDDEVSGLVSPTQVKEHGGEAALPHVPTTQSQRDAHAAKRETLAELREVALSFQAQLQSLEGQFAGVEGASSVCEELGQVISAQTDDAAMRHWDRCSASMQSLAVALTAAQKDAAQVESSTAKSRQLQEDQEASLRQQLTAAASSLSESVRERESEEAKAQALATRKQAEPASSDAALRDRLQLDMDDAVAKAQEAAVAAVAAAQEQLTADNAAQQAAETELAKAKQQADTAQEAAVSEAQAACRAAETAARSVEEASEQARSVATERAEQLGSVKQKLAVAQQENMSRQAEAARSEQQREREAMQTRLERAQAKKQAAQAAIAEMEQLMQGSQESKAAHQQELERIQATSRAKTEARHKAHEEEKANLQQSLAKEADDAVHKERAASKSLIAIANKSRDSAEEELKRAEERLAAVQMEESATKARMESQERAARDASRRAQVAEREKALAAAKRQQQEAEQEAISQERAMAAVKNEARADAEEAKRLKEQIEQVQDAAESQQREKQVAVEALETLRGQFQQITAELELSFDDMRSAGNRQERVTEMRQLKEDDAEARREIMELEADLQEISIQNDQLRRKVQNIQREMAGTPGGGMGRGMGMGMGGAGMGGGTGGGMGGGMGASNVLANPRSSAQQAGGGKATAASSNRPAGGTRGAGEGTVDYSKPLQRPAKPNAGNSTREGVRRNVPPPAGAGPAPRPRGRPASSGSEEASEKTIDEILSVGSRWKGQIDRGGQKVMYSLKITRKDNATGNLVGMHTLLTSSNVVTINPLPEIPGLIRIAEKAKGGIECVVSAQ